MASVIEPGTGVSVAPLATAPRPMMVVDDAHVTYRVFASGKRLSARDMMLNLRSFRGGREIKTVPALRGVSFTANEGETIGVVGHNGSGKSTLFRAMSGLLPTSSGSIWAADRPVLLGVNAALMPQLSGENNIKLGLLAMGFTAQEAADRVDEIADFAELNDFITHPMRTYSSGMGARLRFAIASSKAHSILLVDEALAVGDRRFKLKSEERIRGLRDSAGLVMIVSHSVGSLKDTCERSLWIHKGELRADGPTKDVVAEYTKWTKNPASVAVGAALQPKPIKPPLVDKLRDSVSAKPKIAGEITAPVSTAGLKESARDKARRERYLEATRQKKRRKVIAAVVTGTAVIAAVGAGAAIALVSNEAERTELTELRAVVSAAPTPTPLPTPVLPVIASFAPLAATVFCESVDGSGEAQLSWEVSGATRVSLTGSPDEANPAGVPLLTDLPPSSAGQGLPFACSVETQTYTLVVENAAGQQVSSAVSVSRELPPEPEITVPDETETETDTPVEPEPDPQPQPEQPTEPSIPDPTGGPAEPTPDPTQTPDPQPTDGEPSPEPTSENPATPPPTDGATTPAP